MKAAITLVLFLLLGTGIAQGQSVKGRYAPKQLYVKFPDDAGFTVENKQLVPPAGISSAAYTNLSSLGWWRSVHRLSNEQLQTYRRNAEKRLGKKLPDPASEFHFILYDADRLEEAKKLILAAPSVQKVLRVPIPVNALAPDYSPIQYYGKDIPTGIGTDSIYIMYNNRGAGIKLCDIEYDFDALHVDFPTVGILGPPQVDPFNDSSGINHGTAVLGVIGSLNNGSGTTGLASDCALYLAGPCTLPDTIYDVEAAITSALPALGAGDVMLIEQQIPGPNAAANQFGLVPIEWFEPNYNALVLAVGNGITVVEAAGNGSQNLDAPEYSIGNGGHHPFLPANNSGAIIVGAGSVGTSMGGSSTERSMLWYSNHGSRVDVQANGQRVVTTGYGDQYFTEGFHALYTNNFGGTSSASPIISSAVILMQSVYKQHTNGQTLTPAQVRTLLINNSKPQTDGQYPVANHHIGPLPNAYAATRQALVNAPTGVINIASPKATPRVYPNPSHGAFTIELPSAGKVTVLNMLGMVVRSYSSNTATAIHADLSDQPAGTYRIRTITPTGTHVQGIVVTH